ncbi:MAG: ATP-binding protein [Atopobiaceae bacterium]|nr:ATP-binding protein [Atopobiaceae bacterium]
MARYAARPDGYRPRVVDGQIERYLRLFGAIEVGGTRWCGKTWSSLAHANSVTYVDRGSNLEITRADPGYALEGEKPHLVDEWQRVPEVWDVVRHKVDEGGGKKGSWILTGSSTPAEGETAHSGAGRIGRILMHPMVLAESGDSHGKVSLSGLFQGLFEPCEVPGDIVELARLCTRGGWPELIDAEPDDAQTVIHEYLSAIFLQSIPRMGGDSLLAERLAQSIARNLGQAPTLSTLARDVFALADDRVPTNDEQQTVSRHIDFLVRSYLVDPVPGWVPPSRSPKRMRTKPKRYFADPSLAVSLLGLSGSSLMQDWQTFGLVFENLCMRDLDVLSRALPGASAQPLHYYHDDSDLEVDAIIERADHSWAAVEVKLSADKVEEAVGSLERMRAKLMKDKKARTPEPAFLAVITGTGERAYRRPDGIYVIPIRTLGA